MNGETLPRRGEVWWVRVDKRRPAVVVQTDKVREPRVQSTRRHSPFRAAPPTDAAGALAIELRHGAARIAGPRQVVRVLAVGGDDVVARLRGRDRPDGDGFLADVEVQEAADLALLVGTARRLFETPAE